MTELAGMTEEEALRTRHFPWAATALLVCFLVALLAFSWRVFSFFQKIQSGAIDPGTYALSEPSQASVLAALVANAKGSGTLATSDDPMLGSKDAAVTIVEFGDFGCPYTQEESYVMRALAQTFSSSIRYIYRDFPIEELHVGAERAAAAGTCAHAQGRFWEFHDAVFAANDLSEERLLAIADDIGLNVDAFLSCVNDEETMAEMDEDLADGYDAGVVGTPTFFVNGEKIEGAIPYELFVAIVEAFLEKQ